MFLANDFKSSHMQEKSPKIKKIHQDNYEIFQFNQL